MASLFEYMKLVQRFINDQSQGMINPGDLISFINRARREVAMRAECIRILPPISGALTQIQVTTGGTGYTKPLITVSAPDFPGGTVDNPLGAQAVASATVNGGVITNIDVNYGGSGYYQPTITITDSTGSGAAAVAYVTPITQTQDGQEIYKFSNFDLSTFPGVREVISVRSVSVIFANYRYSLPQYSFSTYQAKIRQFPIQYSYVPTMCSQFGQGAGGSLFLYPIASQPYQLEMDCLAWPSDLITDQDVEAIPDPWTEAVVYLATHYCYLSLQNLNAANYYRTQFDQMMPRYRNGTQTGRSSNPYGRW
jgi:hypothetical protein